MDSIIRTLKGEAQVAPSHVAFRNLGTPGDNVAVKFHDNCGYSPNSYSWYHKTKSITEDQATGLLSKLVKDDGVKDIDLYIFHDGSTMKRENGHVYLPENNGFSVPARNRWVLRDVNGNPLDVQKNHVDVLNGWKPKIGKPLTEEERIGRQMMDAVKVAGTVPVTEDGLTYVQVMEQATVRSINKYNTIKPRLGLNHDPDEIIVDGLTSSQASERAAQEDGFIS